MSETLANLTLAAAASPDAERSLLDRLLGLTRVSWSDEQAMLGWHYPLSAWEWALIVLAAFALAVWSYSRLMGPRPARLALASLRGLLILTVAALIAGPMIVRPEERVEPDTLLVLTDRSASMQIRDTVDPADPARWLSRDEALHRALAQQAGVFGDEALARDRTITWLGFGGEVFPFEPALSGTEEPAAAEQPTTHLRTAIEQALASAGGRPISGIVLFSDGRSPQSTGVELVHRLQQQAVSVFTVPLGAEELPLDLRLGRVDHPEQAFVDDIVPVTVRVERFGGAGAVDPSRVTLRLIDTADDSVLDERTLAEAGASVGEAVRLRARSDRPGEVRWRVELEHDPAGRRAPPLLDRRHRQALISLEILDRPIGVLYVEGYPRWEYRYLSAMLTREESIASSMLLLSADRGFAQEGDRPITRFPRTAEELSAFDVIILGDVPGNFLSSEQVALLRDHVSQGGAGLLWIGGERHTPQDYERTALADLLPMQSPGNVSSASASPPGLVLVPTLQARSLNVLELQQLDGEDASRGVPDDVPVDALEVRLADFPDWPRELAPLRWAQQIAPLKPTAEVLATGMSAADPAAEAAPLVVRLRYGAGQSLYVATDETWRWRYGRGELYFEPYWIQLVRLLGRERVQQTDDRARLSVSSRRLQLEQTLVVELALDDPALLERELPAVAVSVIERAGDAAVDQVELRPAPQDGAGSTRRGYRATWRPARAGTFELRVTEPALDDLNLSQLVEVIAPDDELRQPEPDHDRLIALAEQTGGEVVRLGELDRLVELVPNRARRTAEDLRDPLWHSPLALIVVLVLLTGEWVLRKVIRLV